MKADQDYLGVLIHTILKEIRSNIVIEACLADIITTMINQIRWKLLLYDYLCYHIREVFCVSGSLEV